MGLPNTSLGSRAKIKQILAGLVASMNGLMWGLIVGYSSPAIISFEEDGYAPFPMHQSIKSLMGSIANAGGLIGNVLSGPLTSKFGRKRVFQMAMAPQIAAWLLLGFSKNPAMMIAARVMQGASADLWAPISQLYTVEIASVELRDTLGGLAMFQLPVGMFVSYAVGGLLRWDHMAFAIAGAMAMLWPLTFFLPESPVYLVSKNKDEEAKMALQWLRENDFLVEQELLGLQDQRNLEKKRSEEKSSIKELFQPRFMKPLFLLIFLFTLRQWTGIYTIFTFVVNIFKMGGGSGVNPYNSSLIVGALQIVSQFISLIVVRNFGKKPLAIVSSVLMAVGQLGMGVFFYINSNDAGKGAGLAVLPLISVCVVLIGFNLGLSSFPFVLTGELLPDRIRNHAAGVCFFVNCAMTFLVVEMFFHMARWFGVHGTFWVYSGAALIAAVSIFFLAPDTRGKSLADLQGEFDLENVRGKRRFCCLRQRKNMNSAKVVPTKGRVVGFDGGMSFVVKPAGVTLSNAE